MPSVGIDRRTGRLLTDWDHVLQSIETIFSTQLGDRVMRRHFGSGAPVLLGRLMTSAHILRFFALVAVAIEIWEPRFRVARVVPVRMSPEEVRLGSMAFQIEGSYRPRAHLGDFTPESATRTITIGSTGRGVSVT